MIDCRAPAGAAGPAGGHCQLQLCGRQHWLINWLTYYWPIDDWLQDTANYSGVAANIGWSIDGLIIDGLIIDAGHLLVLQARLEDIASYSCVAANIDWLIDGLIIDGLMIGCRAPAGAAGPAGGHCQLQLCGRQHWLINWLTDYWPIDDWLEDTANYSCVAASIDWLIDWLIIDRLMIDCRAPAGASGPAGGHCQLQLCGRKHCPPADQPSRPSHCLQ